MRGSVPKVPPFPTGLLEPGTRGAMWLIGTQLTSVCVCYSFLSVELHDARLGGRWHDFPVSQDVVWLGLGEFNGQVVSHVSQSMGVVVSFYARVVLIVGSIVYFPCVVVSTLP